jgi:diguanylate cyclase (GGDEF)-like protein
LNELGKGFVGPILVINENPGVRRDLSEFCGKLGYECVAPPSDEAFRLLDSGTLGIVLIDIEVASIPSLEPLLLRAASLILTGRDEDRLKEAIRRWPPDRFVDYILLSQNPADVTRSHRVLATAIEYTRLQDRVKLLADSRETAEQKLRKVTLEIHRIGNALSEGLAKEIEKRVALESRYLRFHKLQKKFDNILRKIYAASDVNKLLDISADIRDLVGARSVSLYIREESENLGTYLKPLVWDDAYLIHTDFARYVVTLQANDFAAFAARTGQDICLSEPDRDPRFSGRYQNLLKEPLRTILVAPIKHEMDVIGVIEVYDKAEHGRPVRSAFGPEDREVLRALSEHISMAMTKLNLIQFDALTGLLRPDSFFERVIQKIETQSKRRQELGSYALAMGDVDWFKNYNDRNGHEAGNRLLRELATVMKSSIRDEDLICRYGGEEFLIFLIGVKTIEEATILTERIRKNIADHYFEFEEFQPQNNLTLSFGVTLFPREKAESGQVTKTFFRQIVAEADIALAEAKGKKYAALKYDEASITKNKVCAYVRDKAAVLSKTSLLGAPPEGTFEEKRKHPRYFTSTLCIIKQDEGHGVANTIDLSLGGAKISTKSPLPVAKTLDFFLILGNRAEHFQGDVVYSRKASPHSAYYYSGVKFLDISEGCRKILEDYFVSLKKTPGGEWA